MQLELTYRFANKKKGNNILRVAKFFIASSLFSILPLTPPSHAYSGEISRAARNVNSRASYFQRDILAGAPPGTDKPRKKLVRHETRDKNSKSGTAVREPERRENTYFLKRNTSRLKIRNRGSFGKARTRYATAYHRKDPREFSADVQLDDGAIVRHDLICRENRLNRFWNKRL